MEITLLRDPAIASEARLLPAETYNTAHILLSQSPEGCVFVPIRSMQYLAVMDAEEIVFVDSAYKNWAAISWSEFQPQKRASLHEPISYMAHYYRPDGARTMLRLQGEFMLALRALKGKQARPRGARIIWLADKHR